MSTLIELVAGNVLGTVDPALGFRQQALRLIYYRPAVWEWIEEHLPDATSEFESEITPIEQLDDLFALFCSGEPILFERQLWPLHHRSSAVWELKTPDLRLFGWFPRVDVFLVTGIDFATRVKRFQLYPGYRDEALRFRDQIELDEPKFIDGDDPDGVITNARYP